MSHQPYPLEWPIGKPRTGQYQRKHSRFKDLAFGKARDDAFRSLKNFSARDVVLSTNVPLRLDGIPYSGWRQPDDPGVAIYFSLQGAHLQDPRRYYAIACDAYRKVEENMRALVHTLEAMRTIERHGSSQLLEQAMSGFAALPPPSDPGAWWAVLGFTSMPSLSQAKDRWRELVTKHHPDRGGTHEQMQRLNGAMERAEQELGR